MVYRPNVKTDLCFVLIPFKSPFLEYYDGIIRPAAKTAGLTTLKSDEIYGTGAIIKDIWSHIWKAAVVIADVTGKNPNVNYELGLCHAIGVPTVLLTQNIEDVPFDYRHRRCVEYDTTKLRWEQKLGDTITETIRKILSGEDTKEELDWPYNTEDLRGRGTSGSYIASNDVRDVVVRGASLVMKSVAAAYGPHGASISVGAPGKDEMAYRQGVAIAFGTSSTSKLEAVGVSMMQRVAAGMRDSVGDGSKLAVILAHELLVGGTSALKAGFLPRDVVHGMDTAVERALAFIEAQAKGMSDSDVVNVALTAAGGDRLISKLVVEGLRKAGKDGILYVQDSPDDDIHLELQQGMYFDRGFLSTDFVTQQSRQQSVLENPRILICDEKIQSMKSLLPVLEQVVKNGAPMLLIADDVEGEALATLIVNKQRGTLTCVPVKAPGFAERRKPVLEDIAVYTGGVFITRQSGMRLDSVDLSQLGRAKKVLVDKNSTYIVDGAGSPEAIEARAQSLRSELAVTTDLYAREVLAQRLAKLVGATCVVRVGGIDRYQVVERRYRVQSGIHSCRAAFSKGIVAGGGVALLRAKEAVEGLPADAEGRKAGIDTVTSALELPIRQQIENARGDVAATLGKVRAAKTGSVGINAETGKVEDLITAGVVDAAFVVMQAIRVAFANTRTMLQTGAWRVDQDDKRGVEPEIG